MNFFNEFRKRDNLSAILIILIGLFFRLILSYFSKNSFDMESYLKVIEIMRAGGNVYQQTAFYNYSPFWSFWLLFCDKIAVLFKLPDPIIIRSTLSLIDTFNALLIFRIVQQRSNKAILAVAFYSLNPAVILTIGYHGQFETMALFPLLILLYLQKKNPSLITVWLLGTAAILIKQIVLFNALVVFVYLAGTKRRSLLMILTSFLTFCISFIPYWSASQQILHQVFGHTGDIGKFGISRILLVYYSVPLFALVMFFFPFFSKFKFGFTLIQAFLISSIGFVVFAPGFYAHYLIIPLLAGAMLPSYWYLVFLIISVDTLFRYHQLNFFPIFLEPFTWIYSVIYLGSFFFISKPKRN